MGLCAGIPPTCPSILTDGVCSFLQGWKDLSEPTCMVADFQPPPSLLPRCDVYIWTWNVSCVVFLLLHCV
ncbi:hypothetical protein MPTK2_4g20390 [Marchantia polymorpha subsp. ruderalis]